MPSKHRLGKGFDKGSESNHRNRQQGLFTSHINHSWYRAKQKQMAPHGIQKAKVIVPFEEAIKSLALQTQQPFERHEEVAVHVNWIVMQFKDTPKFNLVTLAKLLVAILFLSGWRTVDALKQPYCLQASALIPGDRLPNADVIRTAYATVPVRKNYTSPLLPKACLTNPVTCEQEMQATEAWHGKQGKKAAREYRSKYKEQERSFQLNAMNSQKRLEKICHLISNDVDPSSPIQYSEGDMVSYPNFELPLKNLANIFSVLDFIQTGEAARDALGDEWRGTHGNRGASSDFSWEQVRAIAANNPKQIVILVHLYAINPKSAREFNNNFFTITLPEHVDQNRFTQYVSSNAPADAKGSLNSILKIPGAQICDLWNNNFIGMPTQEELSTKYNLYSFSSGEIAVRMIRVDRTEILNLFDGLFNSPDLARTVSPHVRQQVKAIYAEFLQFTCGTEERKLRNYPYCSLFNSKVSDDSMLELPWDKLVFATNSTLSRY